MPARDDAHPQILSVIRDRWSPRAFDGAAIADADLAVIFEAAGWAPSAFNAQPWTFLYARNGDAHWHDFLSGLVEANRGWARQAGVLIYIVSRGTIGEGDGERPSHSHSFDAGAAWAMMALQATHMGYHAHAMTGVDFARVADILAVPTTHRVEAAIAIGRRGDAATLAEPLRGREIPSSRKDVHEIAFNGPFPSR